MEGSDFYEIRERSMNIMKEQNVLQIK